MSISITCALCSTPARIKEAAIGRPVTCPTCDARLPTGKSLLSATAGGSASGGTSRRAVEKVYDETPRFRHAVGKFFMWGGIGIFGLGLRMMSRPNGGDGGAVIFLSLLFIVGGFLMGGYTFLPPGGRRFVRKARMILAIVLGLLIFVPILIALLGR